MEHLNKNELQFYQKTGELFFAVAAADKVIRKSEYEALHTMVSKYWKNLDDFKDEYGVDASYQMEIVFDWLDYESLDANSCFESFKDFYKEHPTLFTTKRKELILKTASTIADAFSGKNKSELMLLGKIQLLFKK
ncbi:MAG: hypothetical protein R2786_06730 [Flavobacteriaceae bacterium]